MPEGSVNFKYKKLPGPQTSVIALEPLRYLDVPVIAPFDTERPV